MTKRVDRHRRRDGNHRQIIDGLIALGCTVLDTADLGHGAPDCIAGWRGLNFLFEIKNPARPKSARKLSADEQAFCSAWAGQYDIIETVEDAWAVISHSHRSN